MENQTVITDSRFAIKGSLTQATLDSLSIKSSGSLELRALLASFGVKNLETKCQEKNVDINSLAVPN